jgi:hypothetical protein
MSERPVPRETVDPIVVALRLVLRDIAEQRAAEGARRRATMTVVEGGKRRGGEAA